MDKRYFFHGLCSLTNCCGKIKSTEATLINVVLYLIIKFYFVSTVFKQNVGISIGINQAPFFGNLFLYSFETKYVE